MVNFSLYFLYMPGCAACKQAEPHFDKFVKGHPFVSAFKLRADGPLVENLGLEVKGTPTYLLRHGEEALVHVGAMTTAQLERWVSDYMEEE